MQFDNPKTDTLNIKSRHYIKMFLEKDEFNKLLTFQKKRKAGYSYKIIKRLTDIFVSLLVILFSWPLMLFIAIYINKNSPGSAIFSQIRIKKSRRNYRGTLTALRYFLHPQKKEYLNNRRKYQDPFRDSKEEQRTSNSEKVYYFCLKDEKFKPDKRKIDLHGQPFTFYKYSTMYKDAGKRFPELYTYMYSKEKLESLKFKIENDPRIPKWANWLRKSSLDELPNFINVLIGDMSIVGPRPDIPEMMKYYTDEQKMKLKVKPGITGLAQIQGRGNLHFQDTLKYDIEYIKNQSFLLDLKIILRTIILTSNKYGAF